MSKVIENYFIEILVQLQNTCYSLQSPLLWATLAALSTKKNQLDISEEAFSSALQIDKVDYMHYIKKLDESPEQMAETAILNGGSVLEAEIILINNQKISQAIKLAIRLNRWERALEIAQKHGNDIEQVVRERKKFMDALKREEMNPKFMKLLPTNNQF